MTLSDRVASLVVEGIAFAVPTDHNHVTDYTEAVQLQPLHGLLSVPGVEVTTIDPLYGHFNAFPFPLDPDKPGNGAPKCWASSRSICSRRCTRLEPEPIVQVNHPRTRGRHRLLRRRPTTTRAAGHGNEHYSEDLRRDRGLERLRSRRARERRARASEWLGMLARGRRVLATGSSDSHTIRSEGAGYPRTYVRPKLAGSFGTDALIAGLREGRAFVTSGPS